LLCIAGPGFLGARRDAVARGRRGLSRPGGSGDASTHFGRSSLPCRGGLPPATDREKLVARGKTPLQAYVAVMRKLLHAIYGMFTTRTPFLAAKFHAAA